MDIKYLKIYATHLFMPKDLNKQQQLCVCETGEKGRENLAAQPSERKFAIWKVPTRSHRGHCYN